jgi:predicted PurR-regulated permease PerM
MSTENKTVRVTVTNRTVVRVLLILLASFIALKFFIKASHVLELIFISFFLCLALNPAVSWIAKSLRLKSRMVATGIAYVIVVLVLGVFVALVVPPLARQSINFAENVPKDITTLQNPNSAAGKIVKKYKLQAEVTNLSNQIKSKTQHLQAPAFSTATKIGSILASIIIVFVLTFMMLVEGPVWLQKYWQLRFGKVEWHQQMARKMYKIVTGYVNGQVLLALIGGAFCLIALLIVSNLLNVSVNSVALAGIIVITGLVPLIGHIIGDVIVVIACLFVSWPLALIMAIILLVYLQIENVTIQPYVQAKFNELTPMLVFIAAILGASVAGLLGAFIAIPFAGCVKVALKEYLAHRETVNEASKS